MPYHLEKRFNRNLNSSFNTAKQVEIKREAILQERRNKLNENFLKVKKRAQEMQALREYQNDLLSKSLALAESNRKFHIEQRRAASKKILERAKRVVLQNQRRSKEEQERRRAELESRIEKTEARRLAHLNRYKKQPKGLIQKSTETQPVKKSSWSVLLKLFYELNLPRSSSSDTWLSFHAISQLIHQAKVIVLTTKVLNTALKQADDESRRLDARVLLTSYLVLMCPKEIFQNAEGEDEKTLHHSAKRMLHLFETWLDTHGRPGATTARVCFVEAWNEYRVRFEAWKSRDREELMENTIAYYVQLSTLRQTMIADQNGDRSVGDQLQRQLDQIKHRLRKLGGSAALESLQRALEHVSASTSTGRRHQEANVKPRTPVLEEEKEKVGKDQLSQFLGTYTSSARTHLQLAHELVLNPEFSLEAYASKDTLESQVRQTVERAFFDQIKSEWESGQMTSCVLGVIKDLKQRLLSLAQTSSSLHERIEQEIDLVLIEQEVKQNVFDLKKRMDYLLDIMSSMCAPVRDSELEAIREREPIEQIKDIFHLLDHMDLDLANFKLRALRRPLMTIAVDYEREKFAEMLNDGTIQLVKTKGWLSESCHKLCQVAAQRNPEKIQTYAKLSHDAIFEEAFVSLLHQTRLLTASELPETFLLDTKRMIEFQNEFQAITIVAALLMLARNFGRANAQVLSGLAVKLFGMLEDKSTSIDHLAVEIERTVGKIRAERKAMIRNMVNKTLSHTDTVYSLLSRRVALVIKSTLQNKRFVSDAVITSNGLEHVHNNLQALSQRVLKLVQHHRQVYAVWYDDIIHCALQSHTNE
ncbi:hypothetical protein G6F60_002882 [Rhizopus arrhizus]|nr:hypothetical protein G6F60_002882 [Rhizopus arrhizus]